MTDTAARTTGHHVSAWTIAEGDQLPNGGTVLSVQRDPATGRVSMAADDGTRRQLERDDRVRVARRAMPASPPGPGRRVRAFAGAVRHCRRTW